MVHPVWPLAHRRLTLSLANWGLELASSSTQDVRPEMSC